MTMYERMEMLRKEAGISQGKLEKELGFSNGSISKWKYSTPTYERLRRYAEYFGVTVEYLQTGNDKKEDDKFSTKQAILDARISNDTELKKAIEIYYTLDDSEKEHILGLIYLLGNKS